MTWWLVEHRAVVVGDDDFQLLDLTGPLEVHQERPAWGVAAAPGVGAPPEALLRWRNIASGALFH